VGGDFYDVFTGSEGQVCLSIGDVSGKGLSAALLMGVIHGVIRAADWVTAPYQHETATENLNRLLCEKTARERFASLFWASFDPKKGSLRYVNAGHLPPLLVHHDSDREPVQRLEGGGPVLGLLPGTHYRAYEVTVEPGDLLVAYSDGILEATNETDEEFGEQRLSELVRNHVTQTPRQVCDEILAAITAFLGPLKPHDDQTLVVLRLLPVPLDSVYAGQVAVSTQRRLPQ
jgi:phosphoserine phosphatase RsbU/P